MNSIQILWSVSPVMTILCVLSWLLSAFVCAVCLRLLYGCIWDGREDVLICEEK